MATVQQQPSKWQTAWQEIVRLDTLSRIFSWVFMLAARLAEPVMLLSVMYVIAEAGVPSLSSTLLQDIAVAALITAPEIILPGSFVVAAQARAAGDRKATLLYGMCWAFVGLTTVTLAALFVLHPSPPVMSIIMCARCAVGVGYSILIRVMFATDQVYQAQGPSPALDVAALLAEHEARTEQRMSELAHALTPTPAPAVDITAIIDEIDRRSQGHIEVLMQSMMQTVTRVAIEQITTSLPAYQRQAPTPPPVVESSRPARSAPLQQFKSAARDMETREQIRRLLIEQPDISSRKAGELVGVSHTTAANYIKEIRQEQAA